MKIVTVHNIFCFPRYELEFFLMHVMNLSENAVGVDGFVALTPPTKVGGYSQGTPTE
jgi:hypothetical protein